MSVRFVRIESHVPRVGPVCDFYPELQRVKRLLLAGDRGMTDNMVEAEGGVISKEIKRIFQRVGEIIDKD